MADKFFYYWNRYLGKYPEDAYILRELTFSVGIQNIVRILENSNGRRIEVKNTLDVKDQLSWRYIN